MEKPVTGDLKPHYSVSFSFLATPTSTPPAKPVPPDPVCNLECPGCQQMTMASEQHVKDRWEHYSQKLNELADMTKLSRKQRKFRLKRIERVRKKMIRELFYWARQHPQGEKLWKEMKQEIDDLGKSLELQVTVGDLKKAGYSWEELSKTGLYEHRQRDLMGWSYCFRGRVQATRLCHPPLTCTQCQTEYCGFHSQTMPFEFCKCAGPSPKCLKFVAMCEKCQLKGEDTCPPCLEHLMELETQRKSKTRTSPTTSPATSPTTASRSIPIPKKTEGQKKGSSKPRYRAPARKPPPPPREEKAPPKKVSIPTPLRLVGRCTTYGTGSLETRPPTPRPGTPRPQRAGRLISTPSSVIMV